MKITKTALDGVVIIEPQVFEDARGYFFESWNKAKMEEAGLNYDFIQDNQSKSCYGTIRGIHFQKGEFSQAKIGACFAGNGAGRCSRFAQGFKNFRAACGG